MLDIAVQREAPWSAGVDWDALAMRSAHGAIARSPYGDWIDDKAVIELAVRLTSDAEVQNLNRQYRHKDKSTNVLSFPMIQPDLLQTVTQNSDDGEVILGDVVLAHDICVAEAEERGVALEDHVAHLIVHGCLHLVGFDHQNDAEAEAMEAIERTVMANLGLHDPYPVRED